MAVSVMDLREIIITCVLLYYVGCVHGYLTTDSSQYVGCVLSWQAREMSEIHTIEDCIEDCLNGEYPYAGVTRSECYCDNVAPSNYTSSCSDPQLMSRCTGNPYQTAGACTVLP